MPLVRIEGLRKTFEQRHRVHAVHAVNGVDLTIHAGETIGLIGESGSGKSTIARLVLRLIDADEGTIEFDGEALGPLNPVELRKRRSEMSIVFQEPYESLNPRRRVREIVGEPLAIHKRDVSKAERERRVIETLGEVGLGPMYLERYPHELSGGQQQRVGIARAIITRPKFVVLDEPTSSLDLSARAQVLALLEQLQARFNLTYLFISHDISTIAHFAGRVAVLYFGQVMEIGPVDVVLQDPKHPYTRALMSSILEVDDPRPADPALMLRGEMPVHAGLPVGCYLYGRCPIGTEECGTTPVPLHPAGAGREVACLKVPTVAATSSSSTSATFQVS